MATFNSIQATSGEVYRATVQDDEAYVEFNVRIGSGVTLTDGDFINLFNLGAGNEIYKMYLRSSDALDTGTATLECACGWDGDVDAVFTTQGGTQFETDPVNFEVFGSKTAAAGASDRLVRLEVLTTANAATDTDAYLYGYAVIKRTAVAPASNTYNWDGHSVEY